ncbi:hypothetical protein K493DRAFT_295540 [Basidiobolus meristosporus CBS 931.73]|uniref:Uncharacterized protein n=1 Tax=Basidiobolus meristosporus CBS 931.73 TaxID=1314790 RepID=A0A1Y1ZAM4_9FUNG|nr:hypothetical protein K493DRAFT_295540 [Basidiobolus meristosporus CBS 931.73]|eukprot:ORY07330.1 hypothetical protein K493DRAFT_295540 [Basidiobolus meristosporus CBS 931.73]
MPTKSILMLCTITSMLGVSAGGIPNIPQCTSCFNNLPKGCVEKIANSRTQPLAAQTAYRDCLCTRQYINNFMNCATCSAKSMNSDQLPTEKDRNDAILACASNGYPIPDPLPSASSTQGGGVPGISASNRTLPTHGPLSKEANNAAGRDMTHIVILGSLVFVSLNYGSRVLDSY